MASTVFFCISFVSPLSVPSSRTIKSKEHCSMINSWSRLSKQASTRTDFTHIANLGKGLSFLQQPALNMLTERHQEYKMTSTRQHSPLQSRCLAEFPATSTVIYGYWVGPDIEDGRGYIEAIVEQIFKF